MEQTNKVVSLFSKMRVMLGGGVLQYRLRYVDQVANREGWYIQVRGGGKGLFWRYAGIYPYKHYDYAKQKAMDRARKENALFVE